MSIDSRFALLIEIYSEIPHRINRICTYVSASNTRWLLQQETKPRLPQRRRRMIPNRIHPRSSLQIGYPKPMRRTLLRRLRKKRGNEVIQMRWTTRKILNLLPYPVKSRLNLARNKNVSRKNIPGHNLAKKSKLYRGQRNIARNRLINSRHCTKNSKLRKRSLRLPRARPRSRKSVRFFRPTRVAKHTHTVHLTDARYTVCMLIFLIVILLILLTSGNRLKTMRI
jgi:hypothetical protein